MNTMTDQPVLRVTGLMKVFREAAGQQALVGSDRLRDLARDAHEPEGPPPHATRPLRRAAPRIAKSRAAALSSAPSSMRRRMRSLDQVASWLKTGAPQ